MRTLLQSKLPEAWQFFVLQKRGWLANELVHGSIRMRVALHVRLCDNIPLCRAADIELGANRRMSLAG